MLDAQDYTDDLYSLYQSIDILLDQIGCEGEEDALADVVKNVETVAIALGITQKIRQSFLSFLDTQNLEIAPKSQT